MSASTGPSFIQEVSGPAMTAPPQANPPEDLAFHRDLERDYPDVFTAEVKAALADLARFNARRRALMDARMRRRAKRAEKHAQWFEKFMESGAPMNHPMDHISI